MNQIYLSLQRTKTKTKFDTTNFIHKPQVAQQAVINQLISKQYRVKHNGSHIQ